MKASAILSNFVLVIYLYISLLIIDKLKQFRLRQYSFFNQKLDNGHGVNETLSRFGINLMVSFMILHKKCFAIW